MGLSVQDVADDWAWGWAYASFTIGGSLSSTSKESKGSASRSTLLRKRPKLTSLLIRVWDREPSYLSSHILTSFQNKPHFICDSHKNLIPTMDLYMCGTRHTYIYDLYNTIFGWGGGCSMNVVLSQQWHRRIIDVDLNWKIWYTKCTVHWGCHTIEWCIKKVGLCRYINCKVYMWPYRGQLGFQLHKAICVVCNYGSRIFVENWSGVAKVIITFLSSCK